MGEQDDRTREWTAGTRTDVDETAAGGPVQTLSSWLAGHEVGYQEGLVQGRSDVRDEDWRQGVADAFEALRASLVSGGNSAREAAAGVATVRRRLRRGSAPRT